MELNGFSHLVEEQLHLLDLLLLQRGRLGPLLLLALLLLLAARPGKPIQWLFCENFNLILWLSFN